MLQQALVTLDLPTNVCPDAGKVAQVYSLIVVASWWIKYFTLEAHSASVADIAQEAVTDGYVPEAMCETVLVCMYGLLTGKVVDLPPEISEHKVTTEDLGKILKWFGPLKGGRRNRRSLVTFRRRAPEHGVHDANPRILRAYRENGNRELINAPRG